MSAPYPTKLTMVNETTLQIAWSDEQVRQYTLHELRTKCPCATCREKRNAPEPPPTELRVLTPEEAQPLRLAGMKPVGNYAYAFQFSDGHDTGIYTLERLRELGETVAIA